MKKAYIYSIINPKGKIYIGSTINLTDRIYRYKTLRNKQQVKVYNSIKRYGWENHKFEVIHECDINDRNYYESYYGILYNSIGENGLNLALPKLNDLYECMSEETKRKIGLAHKGKKITEEHKRKISENSKKYLRENVHPMKGKTPWNKGIEFLKGEKNPMYGVIRSEEWKKEHSIRMTKINKSGLEHHKSKIVLDLSTGIFYDSLRQASIYNNILYPTMKTRIRNGKGRFIYI